MYHLFQHRLRNVRQHLQYSCIHNAVLEPATTQTCKLYLRSDATEDGREAGPLTGLRSRGLLEGAREEGVGQIQCIFNQSLVPSTPPLGRASCHSSLGYRFKNRERSKERRRDKDPGVRSPSLSL